MTTLLHRAFSTVLVLVGLGDASAERLTPAHGWLLPEPHTVPATREAGVARVAYESRPRG